ncbi:MAG: DMT family transporter [Firmicutes bacterium]|nr:DMT family transporter [Bacillota bacterium]
MLANKNILSVLAISITTFFWGISFSSTKILLQVFPAEQIAFLRLVIAIISLAFALITMKQKFIEKKDWLSVLAGGVTGVFLYFLFENNGLRFTNAGTASLIVCTAPVLNLIAGSLFFKERYSWQRWIGVFLSFVGVYFIIRFGNDSTIALENMKGNILVLLAACSWVIFTRVNVSLMRKYNPVLVNFYQSLIGMLCLGILALPKGINFAVFNVIITVNLIYLGVFCSAVAYILYLFALKNLGSATTTTFINMIPVFGVLGGVVILHETLFAGQIIGGALVILGVSIVTLKGNKRKDDYLQEDKEKALKV